MTHKLTTGQKFIGTGSLLLIGILFGISGVIAKYLSGWLSAYQIVEYRFAIALLGLLVITAALRLPVSLKTVKPTTLLLFATTYPISVILFTLSIVNGTVVSAVFAFYAATLVSSFVIGKLYFNEPIHVYKQLALVFVVTSIVTFTDLPHNFSISLGLVFGLLSGVIQGITSAFQKQLSNHTNRTGLLFIQCLAGVVLTTVVILFVGQSHFQNLGEIQWLVVLAFGLILLAITYLFLIGYKYTNLNTGSILVSSELFFGPFFALLFLSENLTTNILIGGILTALAVVFASLNEPAKR